MSAMDELLALPEADQRRLVEDYESRKRDVRVVISRENQQTAACDCPVCGARTIIKLSTWCGKTGPCGCFLFTEHVFALPPGFKFGPTTARVVVR